MSLFSFFKRPVLSLPLMMSLALTGCGNGFDDGTQPGSGNNSGTDTLNLNSPKTGIQLDIPVVPQVSWKDTNGKTQVITQFSVRDKNGVPLSDNEFSVELKVNDKPLDVESLLNQSSKDLEVNLYFAMVLDASYSMTQHTPPAFVPMKEAARDSYQKVIDLWKDRPGNVKFSVLWFDELMNQSQYNTGTAQDWNPTDVLTIPEPTAGLSTKLFSAVNVMANHLKSEYDNGTFKGARDQYVMLVFSDGADNYSYWNNSSINRSLSTSSGASYRQFGTQSTTLENAKNAVTNHPRLTTHVIGLGSAINSDELKQIADAGRGTFQANPNSGNISQLFQRVMQEFTTIQTRGAEIPLPPGEYDFTLVVKNSLTGEKAEKKFRFRAGDYNAAVISGP